MKNEFDDYAKRIVGYFEAEGYKIDSIGFQTVNIRNAKGEAINAYTEPCTAELVNEDVRVRIEFYPVHEREAKKGKIKSISIRPPQIGLTELLKSQKHTLDIAADWI